MHPGIVVLLISIIVWYGVNVHFIMIHVDLLLSFALFTWVIKQITYFHLCSIKQKTKCI